MRICLKKQNNKLFFLSFIFLMFSIASTAGFTQERFLLNNKERFAFKKASQSLENGKKYFEKKKHEEALKYFNKCINQIPYYAEAYYYKSRIDYRSGNYTRALNLIEQAKKNYKKFSEVLTATQMHQINHMRNRREEDPVLKRATSYINPDIYEDMIPSVTVNIPANYYYIHGNIYFKTKKYNEAYLQFLKTREINPRHGRALNNLATIHFMSKDYKGAHKFIREAQSMNLKTNKKLREDIWRALGLIGNQKN
ncbi:MAG: tetratricopeptide repeat protein [Acidobacteriota bacterium]